MFPIRDTIPNRNFPVMTWLIVLVNCAVFVFQLTLSHGALDRFIHFYGMVPARYTHYGFAAKHGLPPHDFWPFLTSLFLHGGWFHIIVNMWSLWIFGDNVEDRMGPIRFLVFYLLCGLAAGFLHLVTNFNSDIPSLGASGAIAGVMGAYLVLYPLARIVTLVPIFIFPLFVEIPAFIFLIFWFAMQFLSGTASFFAPASGGGIAFWAHVGGFVAGIALLRVFLRRDRPPLVPPPSPERPPEAGGFA
jgi:membrane associated rhomboid family serine protease